MNRARTAIRDAAHHSVDAMIMKQSVFKLRELSVQMELLGLQDKAELFSKEARNLDARRRRLMAK